MTAEFAWRSSDALPGSFSFLSSLTWVSFAMFKCLFTSVSVFDFALTSNICTTGPNSLPPFFRSSAMDSLMQLVILTHLYLSVRSLSAMSSMMRTKLSNCLKNSLSVMLLLRRRPFSFSVISSVCSWPSTLDLRCWALTRLSMTAPDATPRISAVYSLFSSKASLTMAENSFSSLNFASEASSKSSSSAPSSTS